MSNHSTISTFTSLVNIFGAAWEKRGYKLEASGEGYRISGDIDQFYLDAVSRDVEAHLALEFLRLQGSETWLDVRDLANDDGIDLNESQKVFMSGKSLEEHLMHLQSSLL
jgi:hypothetical protein